jgi:hypothetical protein
LSQYPQPPQPPYPTPPLNYNNYGGGNGGEPPPAARRAAILMFVLGGLMAGLGLCSVTGTLRMTSSEFQQAIDQQKKMLPPGQPMPFTAESFRTLATVIYGGVMICGMLLFALAVGVRRGGRGAAIGGIVTGAGVLLVLCIFALASLAALAANPVIGMAGCFIVTLAMVLFGLMNFWLAQALRARPAAGMTPMQQYQMQMWYYQQQQQAYQQAAGGQPGHPQPPPAGYAPQPPGGYGYGYGTQVPPKAPPAPPPPTTPTGQPPADPTQPPEQE